MATRSLIGKTEGIGDFTVTYCHWDGYPTGMGKTLWDNIQKYGQERVLHRLLVEYPGWSSLCGTDLFEDDPVDRRDVDPGEYNGSVPEYAHGIPHRNRADVEVGDDMGAQYIYLFSPAGVMTVIDLPFEGEMTTLAMIDLNGEEPDWEMVERGEYAQERAA